MKPNPDNFNDYASGLRDSDAIEQAQKREQFIASCLLVVFMVVFIAAGLYGWWLAVNHIPTK